jgi:hypothetical protein
MHPAIQRGRLGRLLVLAFRSSQSATASIGWLSAAARWTDFSDFDALEKPPHWRPFSFENVQLAEGEEMRHRLKKGNRMDARAWRRNKCRNCGIFSVGLPFGSVAKWRHI